MARRLELPSLAIGLALEGRPADDRRAVGRAEVVPRGPEGPAKVAPKTLIDTLTRGLLGPRASGAAGLGEGRAHAPLVHRGVDRAARARGRLSPRSRDG